MAEVFNADLFIAKWYCSEVCSEDMPGFAADALEAGYDGPALRRLAGLMKPDSGDVGNLFQKAVVEIGTVKVQTEEQAVLMLSRVTASNIVKGRIDPIQGADILSRYAGRLGYPPFLVQFLELSEMPQWGDYAPSRRKLVKMIIEQARLLLANVPG